MDVHNTLNNIEIDIYARIGKLGDMFIGDVSSKKLNSKSITHRKTLSFV
ncbi:hypothetical protein J4727_16115 [Providencia rettgeri]|uniref:Uncharacterized protein n=1 Tax=Providencia rettgeri TaxID=587 RepID=A0A939NKS8_PRORE|nr:hypothetical protein [Providencia rettgeri]